MENAGNQHFLLFSKCFLLLSKREILIFTTFNFSSANALSLITSKILSFVNGLKGQGLKYKKYD